MKRIGDPYWVHGPLVFGPAALAKRFAKDFSKTKQVFEKLRREEMKSLVAPRIAEVLGASVLLLPGGTPTEWHAMSAGGVFVRPQQKLGRRKPESFVVPHALPKTLEVGKDWVLFDSVSGAPEGNERFEKLRAKNLLPIGLAPGRYVIEHSTPAQLSTLEYQAIRLRRDGSDAPAVAPVKRPAAFEITAEMRKQAKKLRFIDTEGGPFIALPIAAVPKWKGIDGEGTTDYDRACSARNNVLGKSEGFVLEEPESTTVLQLDDGVAFVRWVGADSGLDLLAALPHVKRWSRGKVTFDAPGPLKLFDAGLEGRGLKKTQFLEVPLRKGRYEIESAQVQGVVNGGGEVMAGFIRLTRRS